MAIAEHFERPVQARAQNRTVRPSAADPEARMAWVDAAKGAAILLVVIGHAWRGMAGRDLVPEPLFSALDARIYAVHMPMFFALSGMFLASTLTRTGVLAFTGSRLTRLIWPMVLWTYLFLILKLFAGNAANHPVTPADLMIWPVPGHLHMWFLWALFVLHIVCLLTRPLMRAGGYPAPVLAGLALGAVVLALMPLPQSVAHWVGAACHYAPFFVLGLLLGETGVLARLNRRIGTAAALLALALLAVWPAVPSEPALQLAARLVLTAATLVAFAGYASGIASQRWLVTLGAGSMAIYLAHTLFSAGFREAILTLGIRDMGLHIAGGTLAGLLGPLALSWGARRTETHRILGFNGQNRSAGPTRPTVRRDATKLSVPRI